MSLLNNFKSWLGELEIRFIYWMFLDKKIYHKFYNVTLPTFDGGSTQIDYIIVSVYGIFVVEIKTMNGWIYGQEKEPTWTQVFFKKNTYSKIQYVKTINTLKQSLNS